MQPETAPKRDPGPPAEYFGLGAISAIALLAIPVVDMVPSRDNTRAVGADGTDPDLPALAASMQELGQQVPITVYENPPADGRRTYTVIEGHRRLLAAPLAGLSALTPSWPTPRRPASRCSG